MKGIKIFGVLAIASLLFSANAFAQENHNRDENGKIVHGPYETNHAGDNMFIGIGAGINGVIGPISNPKQWGHVGLAADLNFGKWFTPTIGIRLGYHGLWNNANVDFVTPQIAKGTDFGFHYLHGDFMWNISHTIAGYNELRFWNFVPYVTMGVLDVTSGRNPIAKNTKHNFEYAAGAGLLNVLRLGKRINLTIDLKALVGKAHAYSNNAGRFILYPSATLGMQVNLGKTNWDRHSTITPVVIPVPFTTEQYNALKAKVAALEAENAALKDKIAQLEARKPEVIVKEGKSIITPATLYFDFDKATLSEREKAHLEYFINNLPEDAAVEINGYADKTGNATYNQKLAERRAAAVKAIVEKAGVKVAACEGKGVTEAFGKAFKNRVATVKVAE